MAAVGRRCGGAATLLVQLQDLQAALEASELARLAAEERTAALAAGQQASASRELQALQSLFKHAVEENRGLATQLQVARGRIAQLEAAAVATGAARPPSAHYQRQHQQAQQPAAHSGLPPGRPWSGKGWRGQAQQEEEEHEAEEEEAAAPPAVPLAGTAQPAGPWWASQSSTHPGHTVISLSATQRPPPVAPAPRVETAAAPAEPAVPQRAEAGTLGLLQVHAELRALQQRVQVAEQQLLCQHTPCQPAAPASQPLYPQVYASPAAPAVPRPASAAAFTDSRGPSRPASPPWGRPASPPTRPGSACRAAAAAAGGGTTASAARQHEHRENWQLIRSLKQRRAQVDSERLHKMSAVLAASALQQPRRAASPAPRLGGRGSPGGAWQFDTRDPPSAAAAVAAATVVQQPRPRQAVLARPGSATSGWGRRQPAGQGTARASPGVGPRGRSGRETSPMAWHAAARPLPGAGGAAGQEGRGRRASMAGTQGTGGASCDVQRRSRSRSRSQQEDIDRLLMAGRPTTFVEGAGGSSGGGSAVKRAGARQSGSRGVWVAPVVVA